MSNLSPRQTKPIEYVRPVRALHFPVQAEVPETQRHLELRTALYRLLGFALAGRASVGSDQFLYFDASDPRACLAPDVFVKLGGPPGEIISWKVWERGTPELAVEVVSRSDAAGLPWDQKLTRYHRLGVRELVRFEQDAVNPIRIWDYVEGDLVERRIVPGSCPRSEVLDLYWTLGPDERWGPMLRLAEDPLGKHLVKTEAELQAALVKREAEARQHEAQAARQHEAQARQREAEARQRAEQRIRELEAALQEARAEGSKR